MNDTLIKVEDLCKIYNPGENEVRALDHVSLFQLFVFSSFSMPDITVHTFTVTA